MNSITNIKLIIIKIYKIATIIKKINENKKILFKKKLMKNESNKNK